ncbi:hypothetical protein IFM89_020616 [Coptis chinensis]|uniref:CUE domain-containing protein n=1 Tax=Coptis chinensis TaxID=261450 RepID=A0A835IDM9_9MAGN|nr:hypothetical protein IFM89_020616 [Coptis chinensis]
MDPKKSSLNPYASSYIPLSKRGKGSENRPAYVYPEDSVGDDKTSLTKHPAIHKRWTNRNLSEESEMDLAILSRNYPGVSDQSIVDVYFANAGDLEASLDMLKQLEFPVEFDQCLPDTLDIGDVADFGSSAEVTTVIPKAILGEASGSSSGASKYVQ